MPATGGTGRPAPVGKSGASPIGLNGFTKGSYSALLPINRERCALVRLCVLVNWRLNCVLKAEALSLSFFRGRNIHRESSEVCCLHFFNLNTQRHFVR